MFTFITNILADFGATGSETLTVTHVAILLAMVLGLRFVSDLIHDIICFGKDIRKFQRGTGFCPSRLWRQIMLKWIVIIGLVIVCVIFPFVRCVVLHFPLVVKDGSVDLFTYIRYKMWRNIPEGDIVGKIRVYTGLFGKGKTLSAVMMVTAIFDRYNGLRVFDLRRRKFVEQRVVILSNVELSSCYHAVKLKSLGQITETAHKYYESDIENDTYTAIIVLIDELSVLLNSRSFKDNIDPIFLNTLLTCRKYHIGIFGTAQRFNQIDALFRQVTAEVVECNKIWRLQGQRLYDGYELENCVNPTLVEPQARWCKYVSNKQYAKYDTHAMVENIEKRRLEGDIISEDEIRANLASDMVGADTVSKYSRRARKRKPFKK